MTGCGICVRYRQGVGMGGVWEVSEHEKGSRQVRVRKVHVGSLQREDQIECTSVAERDTWPTSNQKPQE